MNSRRSLLVHTVVILILLGLSVVSSGCIKYVPTLTPEVAPTFAEANATVPATQVSPPQSEVTFVELTPSKSSAVEEVAPVLTPDPYPIIHGTQLNQTLKEDPVYSGPPYEFEKTYIFRGNATGLRVNVAEGPLYLIYTVTPQNDCLMTPGSCRGDKTKSINRPYLTITVRDNQTRDVIAEDGYGREFSSDTGKATYSNTGSGTPDGLLSSATYGDVSVTSEPGPRVIKIYKEGTFDITFEGNFLDIDLKVKTGATASGTSAAAASSPASEIPEEEERW